MANTSTIRDIDKWIAELEAQKASIVASIDADLEAARRVRAHFVSQEEAPKQTMDTSPTARVFPGKIMDDEMERIYEEVGKPLHPSDMLERLKARGIQVPGEKPVRNVGAHQSLDKERFASFGNGLWGLAKWKTPLDSSLQNADGATQETPPESDWISGLLQGLKQMGITFRLEDGDDDKIIKVDEENSWERVSPTIQKRASWREKRKSSPLRIASGRLKGSRRGSTFATITAQRRFG